MAAPNKIMCWDCSKELQDNIADCIEYYLMHLTEHGGPDLTTSFYPTCRAHCSTETDVQCIGMPTEEQLAEILLAGGTIWPE